MLDPPLGPTTDVASFHGEENGDALRKKVTPPSPPSAISLELQRSTHPVATPTGTHRLPSLAPL